MDAILENQCNSKRKPSAAGNHRKKFFRKQCRSVFQRNVGGNYYKFPYRKIHNRSHVYGKKLKTVTRKFSFWRQKISNATFASNCVAKIVRISVQHKCRTWVLSNRLPACRRWFHVWTLSWKISAIRSANRRPPEITEKFFFENSVGQNPSTM